MRHEGIIRQRLCPLVKRREEMQLRWLGWCSIQSAGWRMCRPVVVSTAASPSDLSSSDPLLTISASIWCASLPANCPLTALSPTCPASELSSWRSIKTFEKAYLRSNGIVDSEALKDESGSYKQDATSEELQYKLANLVGAGSYRRTSRPLHCAPFSVVNHMLTSLTFVTGEP